MVVDGLKESSSTVRVTANSPTSPVNPASPASPISLINLLTINVIYRSILIINNNKRSFNKSKLFLNNEI